MLDDRRGGDPAEDTITLLVHGPGAYALLSKEAGLHPVSQGKKQDAKVERDVVRVEVLPTPAVETAFAPGEIDVAVRPLGGTRGRLLNHINHEVRIFHPATMLSVRGWCEGSKTSAPAAARAGSIRSCRATSTCSCCRRRGDDVRSLFSARMARRDENRLASS